MRPIRLGENESLHNLGQKINEQVRVRDDSDTIIPPDRYPEVFENIRVWGGPEMAQVIVQEMRHANGGWTAAYLKSRLIAEGLLPDQSQAIIDQVMVPVPGPWAMDGLHGTQQQRYPAPEQYVPADVLFRQAKWDYNEGWGQGIPPWAQDMRGLGQDQSMIDPGGAEPAVYYPPTEEKEPTIDWKTSLLISGAVLAGILIIPRLFKG